MPTFTHKSRRAALVLAGGLLPAVAGCGSALAPSAGADQPAASTAWPEHLAGDQGDLADPGLLGDPDALAARAAAPRAASRAATRTAVQLSFGEHATSLASRFVGVPYVWGGTTPRGFDCSGFTRYVYAKLGKHLPRVSREQYRSAQKVGKHVVKGDLVFYLTRGGRPYHVGIYAGDGMIWHAPNPNTRVRLGKIATSHWAGGRY